MWPYWFASAIVLICAFALDHLVIRPQWTHIETLISSPLLRESRVLQLKERGDLHENVVSIAEFEAALRKPTISSNIFEREILGRLSHVARPGEEANIPIALSDFGFRVFHAGSAGDAGIPPSPLPLDSELLRWTDCRTVFFTTQSFDAAVFGKHEAFGWTEDAAVLPAESKGRLLKSWLRYVRLHHYCLMELTVIDQSRRASIEAVLHPYFWRYVALFALSQAAHGGPPRWLAYVDTDVVVTNTSVTVESLETFARRRWSQPLWDHYRRIFFKDSTTAKRGEGTSSPHEMPLVISRHRSGYFVHHSIDDDRHVDLDFMLVADDWITPKSKKPGINCGVQFHRSTSPLLQPLAIDMLRLGRRPGVQLLSSLFFRGVFEQPTFNMFIALFMDVPYDDWTAKMSYHHPPSVREGAGLLGLFAYPHNRTWHAGAVLSQTKANTFPKHHRQGDFMLHAAGVSPAARRHQMLLDAVDIEQNSSVGNSVFGDRCK